MNIQTKIINNERKWILNIPSLIMKGMNWKDDVIELTADPEENSLKIKNILTKPVGLIGFAENIQNAKYERNKKKFLQRLNQNLSGEGRKILFDTNWDEVEDGGYHQVFLFYQISKFYEKESEKNKNHEFKELDKSLSSVYKRYAIKLKKYLEKKGAKKPSWFLKMDKKLRI
jgi:hypothetical protein